MLREYETPKTMWKPTSTNQNTKDNQQIGITTNFQQLSFTNLELQANHHIRGEE